jgi:inorganic phosphate transporter, PiT family
LAGALYFVCRRGLRDPHLYEPATDRPPIWWMRGILILTCSGVSFSHGTNDGQKSIGLIMLTIIGLFPATYALNPAAGQSLQEMAATMSQAEPLVRQYGDDEKAAALSAAKAIEAMVQNDQVQAADGAHPALEFGMHSSAARSRSSVRDDVYRVIAQLQHAGEASGISAQEKQQARQLQKQLGLLVEYAPIWVRLLSALCLGIGTMIGYKRIVTTLGERLGTVRLTPAQGACAELVSALLIGTAGLTGLPVSTTHIVTSGIAGTMVTSGAGLRYGMISRIVIAWAITLPVTIAIAASLYYLLASPRFLG